MNTRVNANTALTIEDKRFYLILCTVFGLFKRERERERDRVDVYNDEDVV